MTKPAMILKSLGYNSCHPSEGRGGTKHAKGWHETAVACASCHPSLANATPCATPQKAGVARFYSTKNGFVPPLPSLTWQTARKMRKEIKIRSYYTSQPSLVDMGWQGWKGWKMLQKRPFVVKYLCPTRQIRGAFCFYKAYASQKSFVHKAPVCWQCPRCLGRTVGGNKREFCVMTTERTVQIYQLVDPRTGQPFYVGQTIDAQKRLAKHIRDAVDTEKRIRIKDIIKSGEQPQMIVIANVPERVANDYEKLMIKITDGLTNTNHNKDRAGAGRLLPNGDAVTPQNEDGADIVEKAIKENYVLSPGDKTCFVTTKDAFAHLLEYCEEGSDIANKMLIGRVMANLGMVKNKRVVRGKRQHVYEGITLKNTGE